ncbi:MAG TPA: flagellar export chaperone FliS [Polyangiaceae bacterium]
MSESPAEGAMYENTARRYQQIQASTATPGELLLALYDGLFRFLRAAKLCFENKQPAKAREFLSKSHAILSELYIALDYSQAPELCANLESIYGYCMGLVLQCNLKTDPALVDDILRALTPLKEAWTLAVPEAIRNPATPR